MSQEKMSQAEGPSEKEQTETLTRTVIFDLLHLLCNLDTREDLGRLEKSLRVLHAQISDLDGLYRQLGFSVVKQKRMDEGLNNALRNYRKKKISLTQFADTVHNLFDGALDMNELVYMVDHFISLKGMKDGDGKSHESLYRSLSEEGFAKYLEVSSGTIANQKKAHKPLQLRSVSENLTEVLGKLLNLPASSTSRIAHVINEEIEKSSLPIFPDAKDVTDEMELDMVSGAVKKILLDQMKPRLKPNKAALKKQETAEKEKEGKRIDGPA